jgi:hypothetical protein
LETKLRYPTNQYPLLRDLRGVLKDFGINSYCNRSESCFYLKIKLNQEEWDAFLFGAIQYDELWEEIRELFPS